MEYNSKDSLILNQDFHNGRVDIITPPSSEILFKMKEQVSNQNKSTDYNDAIKGDIEDNILAKVFFSKNNIDILQDGLRAGVYKMSDNKFKIPPQSVDNMKIIMRQVYLQHSNNDLTNVRSEIERLNQIILNSIIPTVYNSAISYNKYRLDQSTLVSPLEHPKQIDRDFKHLEVNNFVINNIY
jgi:hypothetical protein